MAEQKLDAWYERTTALLEKHVAFIADEFWRVRDADEKQLRPVRESRKEGYGEFLGLLHEFRALFREDQSREAVNVEEEIQMRLGLWLCSYFLGFPLPHIWERVRHLEALLEAYTGSGALYDKLSGDVYRAERKTRARYDHVIARGRPPESEFDDGPLFVLAFSPTLLLADEDLKGGAVEPPPGWSAARARFFSVLSRLASQYLRLQMWLYVASGRPVRYAFQIEAAAQALRAQFAELPDRDTLRAKVRERLALMGATDHTFIYGVHTGLMDGDAWVSCTLGREDGVLADRPLVKGRAPQRSTWVRSQYLKIERQKMRSLLHGQKEAPEPTDVRDGILVQDEAIEALVDAVHSRSGNAAPPATAVV